MALEEQIVAWARQRPPWQREIMSKIVKGEILSDKDYEGFIDNIVAPVQSQDFEFSLKHLPEVPDQAPPIRINSIAKTEHVNALASNRPLTFEPYGLTIVYGDNGSGKSGYARLLKRITRARHQEDVLSDVFRDTASEKPFATLDVSVGDQDIAITWPEAERSELQRMHFYDRACMDAYISTEADFPYRPAELKVMHGLIEACVSMRKRIDLKLSENALAAEKLPTVSDKMKNSQTGRFLEQLSDNTSIESLDKLIAPLIDSPETFDEIRSEENRLRNADIGLEQQKLRRQAEKLDALHRHIEYLHSDLGNDGLAELRTRRATLEEYQDASTQLAKAFELDPLPGAGSSPWKTLWDSARRFSEEQAYPDRSFPFVEDGSRCVLCHQTLDAEDRNRFLRFDQFVKDDTQVRLDEARQAYNFLVNHLTSVSISTEAVENNLKDLEPSHKELIRAYEILLKGYKKAHENTLSALSGNEQIVFPGIDPAVILDELASSSKSTRDRAADLGDLEGVQQQLASVTARLQEFELLQEIQNSRETIAKEIYRLKLRTALEAAKVEASTGPITRKISEFTEEAITEVVRDRFTRETDRLQLERVTMERTRTKRGVVLHQPKLVRARQKVQLPKVFSEGERSALGLAAFFTEAELDGSKSTIILDDPVTSLDHIRRELVAARLSVIAASRQVIVFTHDLAFVAELKSSAASRGVHVAERSVSRNRLEGGKPGICEMAHPWKAKDVKARLGELRNDLAQFRKEETGMDSTLYEERVALWAGKLSETWERIFSQEIVGLILAEGGLKVRPKMVRILACFSNKDYSEFDASYSRVSQWTKRHDKSLLVNYVAPEVSSLIAELQTVEAWFQRVRKYSS